jgi:glutamate N-acetyltransferase/amino-acid N-acetyltransferase
MSTVAASGFVASGWACGLKDSGDPDLALVATADGRAVPAAAVFTQNLVVAAPVTVSRDHLAATSGHAAAVILNSGNANAATGDQGRQAAEAMCEAAGRELDCAPEEVLVCSTGLIGRSLPIDKIVAGTPDLVNGRSSEPAQGVAAAEAIMTTDTRAKLSVARHDEVVVGGMAKGAGMIAPNMATMLAVLTTNAAVAPAQLQRLLTVAVEDTFNAISIDGCTSTNDTVILLANGDIGAEATDEAALDEAITNVCADLATQIVGDAEGHTKVVRVRITGADSDGEARQAAHKLANSLLVKCSWYGEDPYWGRVASDLGTAGVALDPSLLSIAYGGVEISRGCVEVDHDQAAVAAHMAGEYLELTCDLGVGGGSAKLLTNDLTHAYVDENMGTS